MTSNKCGNLDYVPFSPHHWGPDFIPPFDPVTEDPLYPQNAFDPGSIYYTPDISQLQYKVAIVNLPLLKM